MYFPGEIASQINLLCEDWAQHFYNLNGKRKYANEQDKQTLWSNMVFYCSLEGKKLGILRLGRLYTGSAG